MISPLRDPLRHNCWATRELLLFAKGLSPEQLEATTAGTYGSILATLQHIVGADSRYRARISGEDSAWPRRPEETRDLDELVAMVDDMQSYWDHLVENSIDPEQVMEGTFRGATQRFGVTVGVLLAQALNHGNEHRAQIFTILTTLGLEPPDLDGWSYGKATGGLVTLAEA